MSDRDHPKIGHWYRANGRVYYCVGYAEFRWKDSIRIDMECIQPQDYAAYVTHHFIGENKPPHRTVAEMMCIPMPKPILVSFLSTEKIEEISSKDALSVQIEEQEVYLDTNAKAGVA